MNDFNKQVIDEFRANGGVVSGPFDGLPMILIHHKGAKTGTERVTPLVYQPQESGYAVFASYGGAPNNPAWYHNLMAHPETSVEVGPDTVQVLAREAVDEERERIWERQKQEVPQFAEYENNTDRQIPVVVFEHR